MAAGGTRAHGTRGLAELAQLAGTCRLAGTTSNPWWYAEQLATLPVAFRIAGGPEVRHTARMLGQRLLDAAGAEGAPPA